MTEARKPNETPYLRFGEAERPIVGPAVEIVGNARGLLQLRRQIDRALRDAGDYPLDDAIYRDEHEEEHQVVVRRARSREEMGPPAPRADKTAGGGAVGGGGPATGTGAQGKGARGLARGVISRTSSRGGSMKF